MNVFRLHTLIADHWSPDQSPEQTLSKLNTSLCEMLRVGQYATMALFIVDIAQEQISWSAAAAPSPALIQDGAVTLLDSRGVPLGITKASRYQLWTAPFPKGSSLLLYSDAITEAEPLSGAMLGEDGLYDLIQIASCPEKGLSIPKMIEALFQRVPQPLADDLTCVAIHRPQ